MTITIALAGKGGVAKTTIAGMVIKYLVRYQPGAVLAIDADPSSNLNMVLGLDLDWTVGDIREGMLGQVKESLLAGGAAMGTMPGGVSKRDYLDMQIRSTLAEGERFDLIAMGRSEGPGCYCAVAPRGAPPARLGGGDLAERVLRAPALRAGRRPRGVAGRRRRGPPGRGPPRGGPPGG